MKELNIAIIGQGRSGRDIHGSHFKSERNENFNVCSVVEVDPERRQRALEEYPGCKVYEDYKDKLTLGSFKNVWTYQNWKNIIV